MATSVQESKESHRLECMEVWGGNRAVENTVSVFGIDAWVLSLPAGGVAQGGDIHYVSMCGSGRIARFAVADVSGHGLPAASLAASLRALMKKNINRVDQTRFARALNREFADRARDGNFATAVLTTYFAPTDHLIICNAGHPPPLWYEASTGRWQFLVPDMSERVDQLRNLPLGVIEPTDYHQFAVSLHRGDLVLLYTDLLIEVKNADGQQLGEQGLIELLDHVDPSRPERFNRLLVERLADWSAGRPFDDDLTLLLLRHNAVNPPFPAPRTIIKVVGKLIGAVKY